MTVKQATVNTISAKRPSPARARSLCQMTCARRSTSRLETGCASCRRTDGSVRLEARKRRRIVDIARANAFRAGEAGLDLDKTIDEAITIAMEERERRSRGG